MYMCTIVVKLIPRYESSVLYRAAINVGLLIVYGCHNVQESEHF